jgi:hypothetical protein
MATGTAERVVDAAELVSFALSRVNPHAEEPYRVLLERYRNDPDFAMAARAVADGLGLEILVADPMVGLVVGARPGSQFAATPTGLLRSMRAQAGSDDRMIYGILFAAVAALCFPTRASQQQRGVRRFVAADVDRTVRNHITMLEDDELVLEEDLEPAWRAYADRKQVDLTPKGRLRTGSTGRMAEQVCELLADHDLLHRTVEDNVVVYRSTDRFRHHVARHGGALAYRAVVDSPACPLDADPQPDGHDPDGDDAEHS